MSSNSANQQPSSHILHDDLDFILQHAAGSFEKLRGKKVFLTGGTGFFGTWLLESFVWANRLLDLGARATVLTRDVRSFEAKAPHLASAEAVDFVVGDVCSFEYPAESFTYVIHAATETAGRLNSSNPRANLQTIVDGTARVIDFAKKAGCRNFLLSSSGLVYGPQPSDLKHVPETYRGAPDQLSPMSAYAEGKRVAELLTAIAAQEKCFNAAVARGFAFVGPYLPITAHFAIGNFIRDGLEGGPISIAGDGTPVRSYLYASDLMIWLWHLLTEMHEFEAYNVGSEKCFSIEETAVIVQDAFSQPMKINIARQADHSKPASLYVPSTEKIRREFGLVERVNLSEAVRKTIHWHRCRNAPG
jgi:dTDP-glucose 4,6-dehydratase